MSACFKRLTKLSSFHTLLSIIASLSILGLANLGTVRAQKGESYDLLIRSGRVLDGSGNPWFRADIAVSSGRIVAMGHLAGATARVVIDAQDRYVSPGFIDVHSHAASGLAKPELQHGKPLWAQGLTTLVVNPDGGGPWPLSEQRELLENQGIGLNVALMVGHGSVRRTVMGVEDRPPTEDELERMQQMVRDGMAAGAFGLSSGLYYSPGSYAETEEVIALAKEIHPRGVYASHIRDEGDYTVGLVQAVEEVIRISEEADIPGVVTHFKALGPDNWGKVVPALVRIERARARGISVWTDQYPYEASGTSITGALVPRWALAGETMAGQPSPLERRLRNPRERARLRDEMLVNIARRGGAETLQVARHQANPALEGKTLDVVAASEGLEPVDAALRLLERGGAGLISFNMAETDIATIMKKDYNMTSSDGGLVEMGEGQPHPRFYGAFPRKIRRYVLERGVLSLSQAIRSMTSLPATVFSIQDRGQLRVGAWADILIFDLEAIADRANYQDSHRLAEGVHALLVNGEPVVLDGAALESLPGQVLRLSDASAQTPGDN